jgi:MFS family permease
VTEGASAPDANGGYLDALAVAEFRALFAAYTVSMLGDIVAAVALTVLVFQRTASPFLAGLTFTLAFVPYLFSGALLSGLVDRVPPRRLMVTCDLLSAAIVALMAMSAVPVPALLALLFLLGLISPVAAGMRNALTVVVLPAEAYIAGRSLFRIVAQSAQVVGNATGGLLIALTSPRGALALDCASFAGSALVVRLATRARPPLGGEADGTTRSNILKDSLGGMSAVLADRRIRRVLLLGWLVPTCSVAPESLAAPYVAHLGLSEGVVGWWLAAIPAGTIAGELGPSGSYRRPGGCG